MRMATPLDPIICARTVRSSRWRITDQEGCQVWTGDRFNTGYGRIGMRGKQFLVHRVAWVAASGEDIPVGLTIDHLCRNKPCVSVAHMELVTRGENAARALRRPICVNGHVRADPNRQCPICVTACSQRQNAAIKAATRALGITRKEYTDAHGFSVHTALAVVAAHA